MAGSVIKRGSTWTYIIDVGRDSHGKRRQRKRGGYRTKREAERALREVLATLDNQSYVQPSKLTVESFLCDDWLPAIQPPQLAPATWHGHRGRINLYIVPRLGKLLLQELNAAHLNRLYAELRAEGKVDGTALSPRTVRLAHATIRRALADAQRWGLIPRNVADLADKPRQQRVGTAMKTWTAQQLHTFLAHVTDDRLAASWILVASTGMRRGEVLGLRWEDVAFNEARLSVRQTYVLLHGRAAFSEPKTAGSRRSIDLDARTVDALRTWRAHQLSERMAWGPGWTDTGIVFTRENGQPIDPRRWGEAFHELTAAAGLPRIRLHDLRHTHATLMLLAGVRTKIVSERLGHHSTAFTEDTYFHVIPGMQAEAAEAVARMVHGS